MAIDTISASATTTHMLQTAGLSGRDDLRVQRTRQVRYVRQDRRVIVGTLQADLSAVLLIPLLLWAEPLLVGEELLLHEQPVLYALQLEQPQLAFRIWRDCRESRPKARCCCPTLLASYSRRWRRRLPLFLLLGLYCRMDAIVTTPTTHFAVCLCTAFPKWLQARHVSWAAQIVVL
jgi:hypothetical protein